MEVHIFHGNKLAETPREVLGGNCGWLHLFFDSSTEAEKPGSEVILREQGRNLSDL